MDEQQAIQRLKDNDVSGLEFLVMRHGHKYSWLVRLTQFGSSWVTPVDIEGISTETTDTQMAAVRPGKNSEP